MESYYDYFNNNSQMLEEWKLYKEKYYPYNEFTNYYEMVRVDEDRLYKSGHYDYNGQKMPDNSFEDFMRQIYFGIGFRSDESGRGSVASKSRFTPQEINKKCYDAYCGYRKKDFQKEFAQRKNKPESGLIYFWITLNYKPDAIVQECKRHTERFVNLALWKGCKITYNYEYFTSNENHPHSHILIELNRTGTISLSQILLQTFKDKSIFNVMSDQAKVHVMCSGWKNEPGKPSKKARPRCELQAYLASNKSLKKLGHCSMDKFWRKENKLEPLYIIECV